MSRPRAWLGLPLALALTLLPAGCSDDSGGADDPTATSPSTPITTLSPLPYPEDPPPTGRLYADMRQSSIDLSLGRMQVWIDNDTTHAITPTRIVYRDPRFAEPILGRNLRTNQAQVERGYYLFLPTRPPCAGAPGKAESGTLEVTYGGKVERMRVTDPTDVVGRYLVRRCDEIALAEVADVRWSDDVPDDGSGKGAIGTLTLLVRPVGEPGHELVVEQVSGTHLLNHAADPADWSPGLRVASDGPPARIDLPVKPTRCDVHAFLEGGGATAFRVAFSIDGEPGEVLLRMSPAGMGNALAYARDSCGLE